MSRAVLSILAALLTAVAAGDSAHADPGADITASAGERSVGADASGHTAILSPLAHTLPDGATGLSLRGVALGLTHSVADGVDISVDTVGIGVAVGAKVRVYHGRRTTASLLVDAGGLVYVGTLVGGAVGGVVTRCVFETCATAISVSGRTGLSTTITGPESTSIPVVGTLSVAQRVGGSVKLIGEALGAAGDPGGEDRLLTVSGAVRLFGPGFVVDLGVIHARTFNRRGSQIETAGPLGDIGIPWLAFGARWP